MQLPYLSSSLLVWIDPSEKFVNKNVSRKTLSVLNRVNGNPVRQLSEERKPTWSPTAINNTPGFIFSGEQRLTLDLPPYSVSSKSLGITFATQFSAVTGSIALEIGNSNNTSLAGLGLGFDTGSDLVEPYLFADDSKGFGFNFENIFDNKVHVWSLLFDFANITTKLDGKVVNVTPVSDITGFHFDSLTLGDVNFDSSNSLDHFYFTGNIGTVLVYQGNRIHSAAEDFVMKSSGL